MPTFSRKYLRQTLGRNHTRDTIVSTTTASWSQVTFAYSIIDARMADLSLSGQGSYLRSSILVGGVEIGVASFNVGSGAYFSTAHGFGIQVDANGASGMAYERHDALPAADKDRAIDETIKRLRVRGEVGIDSVKDAHVYPLPDTVQDVLHGYYFASPQGTLDRDRRELRRADVVMTMTGPELRIEPSLDASQQIVLDAITTVTLGTADTATVNIPDERLVLYGAESLCWDLMVRKAPRGTADEYRRLRDEAARQFNLLSARFKVPIDRPPRLDGSV